MYSSVVTRLFQMELSKPSLWILLSVATMADVSSDADTVSTALRSLVSDLCAAQAVTSNLSQYFPSVGYLHILSCSLFFLSNFGYRQLIFFFTDGADILCGLHQNSNRYPLEAIFLEFISARSKIDTESSSGTVCRHDSRIFCERKTGKKFIRFVFNSGRWKI